jgi:thiol-disulfide isomerase/thioredoxin
VTKQALAALILLTGAAVGVFHYKLKPAPRDDEVNQIAVGVTSSTEWQGQIAPDFEFVTARGEHFRLADNIGKKTIILNFFATWCAPCREEMPELNRYADNHKLEPFLLLGIDAGEAPDLVDDFVTHMKLDFPVGIDAGAIRKQYGVSAFPTTVLIGVDGRVQFYESGALANAEVAFDNLLVQNAQTLKEGRAISLEDYRVQSQKQSALPVRKAETKNSGGEEDKLTDRAKQIVARMDCPCGCEKKVQACTCNTSTKIKKALTTDDLTDKTDDDIIRSLNKRFCSGAM